MIEIISLSELRQDGENLGAVFDVVANHPDISKSDIQRALEAYFARVSQSASDDLEAYKSATETELEELRVEHAEFLNEVGAANQSTVDELTEQNATLTARVVEIQAELDFNEALQVQLVAAAQDRLNGVQAVIDQAKDSPSIIRQRNRLKAIADAAKADSDAAALALGAIS